MAGSRFELERKIEMGHYLLKVSQQSRTLEERREGLGDFRQEVELYDQSKTPPLMIGAWDGPMVVRALLKPTGRPLVARDKLKKKDDPRSGFAAIGRDEEIARKAARKKWKAGGPCPECERAFDESVVGEEPCSFCDMPTQPAPAQEPAPAE
jgi:hypothetical protein